MPEHRPSRQRPKLAILLANRLELPIRASSIRAAFLRGGALEVTTSTREFHFAPHEFLSVAVVFGDWRTSIVLPDVNPDEEAPLTQLFHLTLSKARAARAPKLDPPKPFDRPDRPEPKPAKSAGESTDSPKLKQKRKN